MQAMYVHPLPPIHGAFDFELFRGGDLIFGTATHLVVLYRMMYHTSARATYYSRGRTRRVISRVIEVAT